MIKRVHIEISTRCNSGCVTCPQNFIQRPLDIDAERVRRLIREDCAVYGNCIEAFEFHNYNEPFLTFDLFYELALMVKELYGPFKVGVVSNGSIMTEDMATKLLSLKLAYIYLSIDGFSKEVYEAHRVGLDRDVVYRNVDYFIGRCQQHAEQTGEKLFPRLSWVITERNRHEMEQFKEYFKGKHCGYGFQDCDGRGEPVGRERALNNIWHAAACDYALDGVYILSNLDVVPCCLDWSGMAVMGNLGSQTLQGIVEGEPYAKFRELQHSRQKREIELCLRCKSNMIYGWPRSN